MEHTKTALYCRVARHDDATIANQLEKLRLFAQERGICDPVVFMDNGYSGLTFERPGFSALEDAMRAGQVQTVIVSESARIGRDPSQTKAWVRKALRMGVRVLLADNPEDDLQDLVQNNLLQKWFDNVTCG